MKEIIARMSNRVTALALGGMLVAAGSAVRLVKSRRRNSTRRRWMSGRWRVNWEAGPVCTGGEEGDPGSCEGVHEQQGAERVVWDQAPGMDDFFRRFFGEQMPNRMPRRNFGMPRQQGLVRASSPRRTVTF